MGVWNVNCQKLPKVQGRDTFPPPSHPGSDEQREAGDGVVEGGLAPGLVLQERGAEPVPRVLGVVPVVRAYLVSLRMEGEEGRSEARKVSGGWREGGWSTRTTSVGFGAGTGESEWNERNTGNTSERDHTNTTTLTRTHRLPLGPPSEARLRWPVCRAVTLPRHETPVAVHERATHDEARGAAGGLQRRSTRHHGGNEEGETTRHGAGVLSEVAVWLRLFQELSLEGSFLHFATSTHHINFCVSENKSVGAFTFPIAGPSPARTSKTNPTEAEELK
jgi:hypothetical protein